MRNVIRGVTKNMFAAVHYSALFAAGAVALTFALSVLPFFAVFLVTGWARVLLLIAAVLAAVIHGAIVWQSGRSPLYGLTHPLGALIFCWMITRSAIATLWRGGVVWRDTFYPLDELRRGMV